MKIRSTIGVDSHLMIYKLSYKEIKRQVSKCFHKIFTTHFFHGADIILRFSKTNKPVTFGFIGAFVTNNFGFRKRGKVVEMTSKKIIRYVIAQVSDKQTEVI